MSHNSSRLDSPHSFPVDPVESKPTNLPIHSQWILRNQNQQTSFLLIHSQWILSPHSFLVDPEESKPTNLPLLMSKTNKLATFDVPQFFPFRFSPFIPSSKPTNLPLLMSHNSSRLDSPHSFPVLPLLMSHNSSRLDSPHSFPVDPEESKPTNLPLLMSHNSS